MVKIYKGVVVYQNIGNVVIPDAQVDDLKVNNIATINTLDVLDTLGLSRIKLNSGTISSYPVGDYDIVNKKYVDDNESPFDPTQHIILSGNPDSLTVKNATSLEGATTIDANTTINAPLTVNSNSGIVVNSSSAGIQNTGQYIGTGLFKNSNDIQVLNKGIYIRNGTSPNYTWLNMKQDSNNEYSLYSSNVNLNLFTNDTLYSNSNAKGLHLSVNGVDVKGNTSITGNLTTTEGIKAGSGQTQITLDTQTGEIKGTFLTTSNTITAGTGNNQILLNTSNGNISGKSLTLTSDITAANETLSGTLTVSGITNFNNDLMMNNAKTLRLYDRDNTYYMQIEGWNAHPFSIKAHSEKGLSIFTASNNNMGDDDITDHNTNHGFNINSTDIKVYGSLNLQNGGQISTTPSDNNDIVNKAYVDAAVSGGGFDPSQTLTLTNQNSLITNGDITTKTLLKTEKSTGGTISSNLTYIDSIGNFNTTSNIGLFYDPKHNKLFSIIVVNENSYPYAHLYIYDLSTHSSSTVKIQDGNGKTMSYVGAFHGSYNYINDTLTFIISGQYYDGTDAKNYFTFYNYNNNTFSTFKEIKYNTKTLNGVPPFINSFDSKYVYFYSSDDSDYSILLYNNDNDTMYYAANLANDRIYRVFSFDTNEPNRFFLVSTDNKIYLYSHTSTFSTTLLREYTFSEDTTEKHFIYGENNKTCYIISTKYIYRLTINETGNNFDISTVYDNSSSNYSYANGIINYDGTLYIFSHYYSDQYVKLQQYIFDGNALKLITEQTYSGVGKLKINFSVIVNSQIYCIGMRMSGSYPFYLYNINSLNNSTIISTNQTSLNGTIRINDNNKNNNDYPTDINEVITYGKLLKILKNCTISGSLASNDCYVDGPYDPQTHTWAMYYGHLDNNTFSNGKLNLTNNFINSNQYISSNSNI